MRTSGSKDLVNDGRRETEVNAPIQAGDSGGPLITAAGKVVGMTTAGSQSAFPNQNNAAVTGYAIPVDTAVAVVKEIRSGSGPGIHMGNGVLIGVEVAAGGTTGALVHGVEADSPAAGAGLVAGDLITAIGGQTITDSQDLQVALRNISAGQRVTIVWTDASGAQPSATLQLAPGARLMKRLGTSTCSGAKVGRHGHQYRPTYTWRRQCVRPTAPTNRRAPHS